MKLFLASLLLCASANAATYYVRTDGNDANTGLSNDASHAWLTIQHASDTAVAGDTVTVGAGTWSEFVEASHSGSAGNPITFTGTKSGSSYLTILDPSTDISGSWVPATELGGAPVYKRTGLAFETKELTIGGRRVGYCWTTNTIADFPWGHTPPITTGAECLTLPSSEVITIYSGGGVTKPFWDGIEALWAAVGTTTYLRLRDGSDPSALTIRAAPNYGTGVWTMDLVNAPTWLVSNQHDVTIQNFAFQNSFCGVQLKYTNSYRVNVLSNYFYGHSTAVQIYGEANNNVVTHNDFDGAYYGYAHPGAWGGTVTTTEAKNSKTVYELFKYLAGQSSQSGYGVYELFAGTNNVIAWNTIHDTTGNGINLQSADGEALTSGSLIYSNSIWNHPSTGVVIGQWTTETQVYDNVITNCESQVRIMQMNYLNETNRSAYVFRNRCHLPPFIGQHLFLHLNPTVSAASYYPRIWYYHNSCSGGYDFLTPNDYAFVNGGHQETRILNNVVNGCGFWFWVTGLKTLANGIGSFDYNLFAASIDDTLPVWYGAHNATNSLTTWATNAVPTFFLPPGSQAINTALDLPTTYPALPQDATVKVGPAWDMGWNECAAPDTLVRINNVRWNNVRINVTP